MKVIPRICLFLVAILLFGCDQLKSDKKSSTTNQVSSENFEGIEKLDNEYIITIGLLNQDINTVYLYKYIEDQMVLIDSADIDNQFSIKGTIDAPAYFAVKTNVNDESFKFLVDASYIRSFYT